MNPVHAVRDDKNYSDCVSLHNLQSLRCLPVAVGRILESAVPVAHHLGQVGQRDHYQGSQPSSSGNGMPSSSQRGKEGEGQYLASMHSKMREGGSLYLPYVPHLETEAKEDAVFSCSY
jgi:hypothetical protein